VCYLDAERHELSTGSLVRHCPKLLPLTSSINSRFQYCGGMRARSNRKSKASLGAIGLVDNIIAVTVYVVVAGLALSELYRFVQRAFSR
jgi:hypothetical protein